MEAERQARDAELQRLLEAQAEELQQQFEATGGRSKHGSRRQATATSTAMPVALPAVRPTAEPVDISLLSEEEQFELACQLSLRESLESISNATQANDLQRSWNEAAFASAAAAAAGESSTSSATAPPMTVDITEPIFDPALILAKSPRKRKRRQPRQPRQPQQPQQLDAAPAPTPTPAAAPDAAPQRPQLPKAGRGASRPNVQPDPRPPRAAPPARQPLLQAPPEAADDAPSSDSDEDEEPDEAVQEIVQVPASKMCHLLGKQMSRLHELSRATNTEILAPRREQGIEFTFIVVAGRRNDVRRAVLHLEAALARLAPRSLASQISDQFPGRARAFIDFSNVYTGHPRLDWDAFQRLLLGGRDRIGRTYVASGPRPPPTSPFWQFLRGRCDMQVSLFTKAGRT